MSSAPGTGGKDLSGLGQRKQMSLSANGPPFLSPPSALWASVSLLPTWPQVLGPLFSSCDPQVGASP